MFRLSTAALPFAEDPGFVDPATDDHFSDDSPRPEEDPFRHDDSEVDAALRDTEDEAEAGEGDDERAAGDDERAARDDDENRPGRS